MIALRVTAKEARMIIRNRRKNKVRQTWSGAYQMERTRRLGWQRAKYLSVMSQAENYRQMQLEDHLPPWTFSRKRYLAEMVKLRLALNALHDSPASYTIEKTTPETSI
jgi:hypothetical protein